MVVRVDGCLVDGCPLTSAHLPGFWFHSSAKIYNPGLLGQKSSKKVPKKLKKKLKKKFKKVQKKLKPVEKKFIKKFGKVPKKVPNKFNFFGQVMSPRHSDHMSQGSQVSQSALW